ncbi:(2Fe-2S)-binding protein [Chromatiales bacterium (ex Bugula neritina AB1)]|nr:(2Fe-2S)-binding protein [Chromatiales bacterium (ex Bugula neritina AB1)]
MNTLHDCRKNVEQASCLPPQYYVSSARHTEEVNKLFTQQWLGIGRSDVVKNAGDYVTLTIANVPIILLRDSGDQLRAYNNSCRHRGAQLLQGSGECRQIRCPFHCWTYGLDGLLKGAPHLDGIKDFDRNDFGLVEFTVKTHAGFTFLCMADKPPPFEQFIGDFDTYHSAWPLASLITTRRREFSVECNWKAFLDVFNEYYHLQYVHKDSINDLYNPPNPADSTSGSFATQFGATEGTGALLQHQQDHALPLMPNLPDREANGARYTWLFPNMTFAAGKDSIWVYEAYPLDANHCHVIQSICFPEQTITLPGFADKARFYYDRLDAAMEEDRIALENQHRGLRSPFASAGRFSPALEPNVAAFAHWYAGIMG